MGRLNIRVCVVSWRRGDYLGQVLDGLASNPNVGDFEIHHAVDYARDDKKRKAVMDAIMSRDTIPCTRIEAAEKNLGCTRNIRRAIELGFEDDDVDAIIMLEDDTVPSSDFLSYMTKALETYEEDETVGSITGYSRRIDPDPDERFKGAFIGPDGDPLAVRRKHQFCCWGWATWRRFYENKVVPNWQKRVGSQSNSWDILVNSTLHNGFWQIRPHVGRVQNIGAHDGFYVHDPEFHREFQHCPYWMGNLDHEVDFNSEGAEMNEYWIPTFGERLKGMG